MFKRAGKILSILAMMAIAVNAQCALSCSFQTVPVPDAHACCKHDKVPMDQQRKSCPEPVVVFADDIYQSQAVQCIAVPFEASFQFSLAVDTARLRIEQSHYHSPEPPRLLSLRI